MDGTPATDGHPTSVEWRLVPSGSVLSPIVKHVPYLEVKLEHPDLEPTGHGGRFFPDAVPYELDGVARVFYWRPALVSTATDPGNWQLVCATPHELVGIDSLPADTLPLVTENENGTTLLVEGTIGGDVKTSHVQSYAKPDVSVDSLSDSEVELTVEGSEYVVTAGKRRRIPLDERQAELVSGDVSMSVTPELVVRYPGRRELHHPARGSAYRLFPSFDLDIDEVPNPLSVPTTADELDDRALAIDLGVDLSQRPYPERVLWQAFAYSAFDPHCDSKPELTQLQTGHIVLRNVNAFSQ